MEAKLQFAIAAFPGKVNLYAKNLDTGKTYGLRQDERVRTASTIKLPIMAAVFSAVAQGKVKWDETLELREQDKVSGTGILREMSHGQKLPLRDLVHLMIVVSDNTATNLILDRLTPDFVNAEIGKLGLAKTRVLRKILANGPPAGYSREGLLEEFRPFGLGVSTPLEMVTLLEKLERGEVVSPDASREMLAILERQQDKEGIGRHLSGNRVASKSGTLDRLRSDAGIVYSIGGRIAIAITADDMRRTDWSPDNAGKILLSQLAGILLDGLAAPHCRPGRAGEDGRASRSHGPRAGNRSGRRRLWVTWVDREKRRAISANSMSSTGKLLRSVPIHKGERYHPEALPPTAILFGYRWPSTNRIAPRPSSGVVRRRWRWKPSSRRRITSDA
jgi:beta-lactamase class A